MIQGEMARSAVLIVAAIGWIVLLTLTDASEGRFQVPKEPNEVPKKYLRKIDWKNTGRKFGTG